MARFKVCYSGYAYVEAESDVEAKEKFLDDQVTYDEMRIDFAYDVDAFGVEV